MICFVIYGVNLYVVKHNLIVLKKIYDILMILVDFRGKQWKGSMILANFFATRIRFIEADPYPTDQNETDPNGSGSATLVETNGYIFP